MAVDVSYVIQRDTTVCPVSLPWAVREAGDDGDVVGCHGSRAEAQDAIEVLNAAVGKGGEPADEANSVRPAGAMRVRSVAFELAGAPTENGDGLTFEGYAAVFNSPTMIDSWEGRFEEIIAPGAFTDTLRQRTPTLLFEHGQHPLLGSMPLGTITSASEDSRGLYIQARLTDNWLVQPVRDAVRDGAIDGMSFRFTVPKGGDTWTDRKGNVPLRALNRIDVPELGPVVFPAYEMTTASVRSLVEHLPDFTGRVGARSAPGGEHDAGPEGGAATNPVPQRIRVDHDALRLRGVI